MTPVPRRRAGMALVLVLALLGVLSALVLHLLASTRFALRRAEGEARDAGLRAAAGDGVRRALQRLADDEDPLRDDLAEAWAKPEELVDPAGVTVRTRIEDEDRRFDANNLSLDPSAGAARRPPEDILNDLLSLCGDAAPAERVRALRDWTDADHEGPYEQRWYADMKRPCVCADRPLYSWSEAERVAGFSRAYFEDPSDGRVKPEGRARVRDVLTLLPGARTPPWTVNLNTASEAVLLGLFGRDQAPVVGAVLSLREAEPLRSIEPIALLTDPLRMDRLRPYLDVRSHWFTIDATAERDGRSLRIVALARRETQGALRVVRWLDGVAPAPAPPEGGGGEGTGFRVRGSGRSDQ